VQKRTEFGERGGRKKKEPLEKPSNINSCGVEGNSRSFTVRAREGSKEEKEEPPLSFNRFRGAGAMTNAEKKRFRRRILKEVVRKKKTGRELRSSTGRESMGPEATIRGCDLQQEPKNAKKG